MAVVGTNNWNAIAYGNGKYVAVGKSGYVTTSTDGKTWTTPKQIAGSSYTWNGIIYANGKFVACGQYSYIAVSTDGTNWTTYKVDSSATYNWADIAYGNGKFVVVGSSGRISSSSNGTSWTTPEYYYSYGSWLSIAYGNGKFVASSTNGRLYTSDDTGQTWSYIVPDIDGLSPTNNDRYLNIIYNGEMFIAVGYNYSWNDDESRNLYTDIVTTSIDGVNWSKAVPIKDELGNILRLTTLSIIAMSA